VLPDERPGGQTGPRGNRSEERGGAEAETGTDQRQSTEADRVQAGAINTAGPGPEVMENVFW